jgi:hypothetical protein
MRFLKVLLVGAALLLSACATSKSATQADATAREQQILARVDLLLERYAKNDQAGVIAMVDTRNFLFLGTDFSEKIRSVAELKSLMDRDFQQWGTANFTDRRDTDVRVEGNLASVYFLFTFSASSGPSLPVRMTTTWRQVNGEWLLTQSSNALPPRI